MTHDCSLRVSAAKKGILLGKTHLRDESGSGRWRPGGDVRGKRDGGELGWEDMREVRDEVSKVEEETVAVDDGGGTGIGDNMTSVIGSTSSEVTISQYLSLSRGDIDW